MEDYPSTLLEFERRFPTEDACRTYLRKIRWPHGFQPFAHPHTSHGQQPTQRRGAVAVAEEAVGANPVEARWQHVEEKAAQ